MANSLQLDDFSDAESSNDSITQYTLPEKHFRHSAEIAKEFFERYSAFTFTPEHDITSNEPSSTYTSEGGDVKFRLKIHYNIYRDGANDVHREFLKSQFRGRDLKDFERAPSKLYIDESEPIELKTEILKKFLRVHPDASSTIQMLGGHGLIRECIVVVKESIMGSEKTSEMHIILSGAGTAKNHKEYKELHRAYGEAIIQ